MYQLPKNARWQLTAFARSSAALKALSLAAPSSPPPAPPPTTPPSVRGGAPADCESVRPTGAGAPFTVGTVDEAGAGPEPRRWPPLWALFGFLSEDVSEKQFPMAQRGHDCDQFLT